MNTESWCLIESDPGVFSELITCIGVHGVQVEEVYDVDPVSLSLLPHIYGFIFLYKCDADEPKKAENSHRTHDPVEETWNKSIYFAKQMIRNSCATNAIINLTLNLSKSVRLSKELQDFKEFTQDFTPELKGISLGNCAYIKNIHNSFSTYPSLDPLEKKDEHEEDSFHFVAILPVQGKLYELDGLTASPIVLAEDVTSDNWIAALCPILMRRMNRCADSDIRFNLMAVVKDRLQSMQEDLLLYQSQLSSLSSSHNADESQKISSLQQRIHTLSEDIQDEKKKRARYTNENLLRKHNLLGMVSSFCRNYNL